MARSYARFTWTKPSTRRGLTSADNKTNQQTHNGGNRNDHD